MDGTSLGRASPARQLLMNAGGWWTAAPGPHGGGQTVAMDAPRWTVEHLVADLRRLGVVEGDLLMVHASLRAIGPVLGGADGVIDALEVAVCGGHAAAASRRGERWDCVRRNGIARRNARTTARPRLHADRRAAIRAADLRDANWRLLRRQRQRPDLHAQLHANGRNAHRRRPRKRGRGAHDGRFPRSSDSERRSDLLGDDHQ